MGEAVFREWHYLIYLLVNVQVYMNRYVLVPLTAELTNKLAFGEKQIGLLGSIFWGCFTFSCLIFGYLGDRTSRKRILVLALAMEGLGLAISGWTSVQYIRGREESAAEGSLDSGSSSDKLQLSEQQATTFFYFALGRGLTGLFQSAFTIISVTVIADMFKDPAVRSKRTSIFAISLSVGIAVGFGLGSVLAKNFGLSVPLMAYAALSFLAAGALLAVPEYQRGQGEKSPAEDKDSYQNNNNNNNNNIISCSETYKNRNTNSKPSNHSFNTTNSETVRLTDERSRYENCTSSFETEPAPKQSLTKSLRDLFKQVFSLFSIKTFTFVCIAYAFMSALAEVGMAWMQEFLRRQFVILEVQRPCKLDMFEYVRENAALDLATCQQIKNTTYADTKFSDIGGDSELNCQDCMSDKISSTFGMVVVAGGAVGSTVGAIVYNYFYPSSSRSGAIFSCLGMLVAFGCISMLLMASASFTSALAIWLVMGVAFFGINSSFAVIMDMNNRCVVAEERSFSHSLKFFVAKVAAISGPFFAGVLIEDYKREALKGEEFVIGGELNAYNLTLEYQEMQKNASVKGLSLCSYFALISALGWVGAIIFWPSDEERKNELQERRQNQRTTVQQTSPS